MATKQKHSRRTRDIFVAERMTGIGPMTETLMKVREISDLMHHDEVIVTEPLGERVPALIFVRNGKHFLDVGGGWLLPIDKPVFKRIDGVLVHTQSGSLVENKRIASQAS